MGLPALHFEGYEALSDRPHVMVDGAARPSSVLTLSHWPQSPTPLWLARDVSAESVLEYLRLCQGEAAGADVVELLRHGREAVAVTNDHFDEDGLMSVFALVEPAAALGAAELLVAVATCGDFGVVAHDHAARISFAISPLAEVEAGAGAGTSGRYEAVLPRVAELVAHPERFQAYWERELTELRAGREAITAGDVRISERPELDLAVVDRPGVVAEGRLPGATGGLPVHAAAVHSATKASRLVAFDGDRCECYLRYEGWVRTVSRRVPLRPDLAPLAAQLSAEEPSPIEWEANGVGAIVGRLRPGGEGKTELDPARVVALVSEYLATAQPAWDPWRPGGAYIPAAERQGYVGRYGQAATGGRSGKLQRGRRRRRG